MSAWKDSTTYSQNDKERNQTAWTATQGGLRITITKSHRMNPEYWTMHCHEVGIDTKSLGLPVDVDPGVAKGKALSIVRQKLMSLILSLNTIEGEQ